MGIMDNIKDKMSDMDMDGARKEYNELMEKDRMGMLDDRGRERMHMLGERLGM